FLEQRSRARVEAPQRRLVAPETKTQARPRLEGERDMLDGAQLLEEAGDLERARNPALRDLMRTQSSDIDAEEKDSTARRHEEAGQEVEEARLARAVRPNEGVDLPLAQSQVHAVHRSEAGEVLSECMGFDGATDRRRLARSVQVNAAPHLNDHLQALDAAVENRLDAEPNTAARRRSLWGRPVARRRRTAKRGRPECLGAPQATPSQASLWT